MSNFRLKKKIVVSIFFENALYLLSISLQNALYFALYFSVCALYG